jgi:MYXO-CTERM domain-containing protein
MTGSAGEAIYGGVLDGDAADDGVVALRIGNDAASFRLCTGAVIAPDVVLTAHHCVAASVAPDIACDTTGASLSGTQLSGDIDATTVHVYTGAQPDIRYGTPAANGKSIVHTVSSALCNSDVALVVLDAPLAVAPLAVRLTAPTQAGEAVRAVGYGETDGAYPTGTRMKRDHLAVKAVGAGVAASGIPLGSHEIELGEATCNGDSGGPAISEATGAVIGIVSRATSCTDDFGHVYIETNGFASLIGQVVAAAGSKPLDEPVAPTTPTSGAPSAPDAGAPIASPTAGTATDAGATPHARENGYTVTPAAKACAMGGGPGEPGLAGWTLAAAAAIAASRRRKRR